jgi:hypothetical protein
LIKNKQKNEGVAFGLNSLKFGMPLMCPSVTPDCLSKNQNPKEDVVTL